MKWVIAYAVCPILTCIVLWFKQGRFLAWDVQIIGAVALGPVGLLLVVLAPRSWLTSREKSGG